MDRYYCSLPKSTEIGLWQSWIKGANDDFGLQSVEDTLLSPTDSLIFKTLHKCDPAENALPSKMCH